MKKSTLFFLSTLIAVLLSASTSYAYYSTSSECRANCSGGTCGTGNGFYVCYYGGNSTSGNVFTSPSYATLRGCQRVVQERRNEGCTMIRDCYSTGSYYRYQRYVDCSGTPSCPANCSSCSSSSVCTTCNSGYYLSSGSCVSCPANATCNGSTFTCNSGYKKSANACVKDRTVGSCPSRMTLSSDGCCCINK